MHVSVKDILAGEVGAAKEFSIENERPELADIDLVSPINGRVRIIRTEDGLIAKGRAEATLRLTCDRCLREFSLPLVADFSAGFTDRPEPDQWPIDRSQFQIDLEPVIRQELLLGIPIKRLCQDDCLGLCDFCGQYQETPHQHEGWQTGNRPRIIKGKHHGSSQETHQ